MNLSVPSLVMGLKFSCSLISFSADNSLLAVGLSILKKKSADDEPRYQHNCKRRNVGQWITDVLHRLDFLYLLILEIRLDFHSWGTSPHHSFLLANSLLPCKLGLYNSGSTLEWSCPHIMVLEILNVVL